ncbi:MAG: hypothetical protein QNJ54_35380 [Prochloraceae cyanobacterium]|nr:hypothetical protein [Prochloraceae cyanobacterium]
MRRIGIIGAGQAGLCLGISLVDAGYDVTIFSDRTADDILNSKLKSTPLLFHDAIEIERNLGLNFWDEESPVCTRFRNQVLDTEGNLVLDYSSNIEKPWQAVDQRLKFSSWIEEFVRRGGELIIQEINLNDLDKLARNYDLVVVAVGKGDLATLFERDEQRARHNKPKRHLGAGLFAKLKADSTSFHTFEVTNLPHVGEIFQFPFYDRNENPCSVLGFQAHPQGVMDRFSFVQNGGELQKITKELIQQFKPREYEIFEDMELNEENGWLCGAITPIVRRPVGHLPSGGIVMGIGDAVILHDPIAAQGANNANKMAHLVSQRIIERGDRPFNASWMGAVFNEFWEYVQYSVALTDCLLAPPEHLQDIIKAMAENPDVLKDYFNGCNNPPSLSPWFFDPEEAKKYLAQKNPKTLAIAV